MLGEARVKVGITLVEEMTYKCDLGKMDVNDFLIDETHKRYSDKVGPNPTSLLALSVLSCLAASFTFCLKKKGFTLNDLNGRAEAVISRNKKGFWRIKAINITITPNINNPNMRKRADQCIKFFEQYCIISESLRDGMEIDVKIDY